MNPENNDYPNRNEKLIKDASFNLYVACKVAMSVFRSFDLGHLLEFEILDRAINKAEGWTSDENAHRLD